MFFCSQNFPMYRWILLHHIICFILGIFCVSEAFIGNCNNFDSISVGCSDSSSNSSGDAAVPQDSVQTCVAVNGCSLTVPCGNLTPSPNQPVVYDVVTFPSLITRFSLSAFLVLNITILHHKGRVVCRDGNDGQVAEYLINVTYPPMEVELQFIPDPILKRGLSITCPIAGNPMPEIQWKRYSDIDEASVLPLPNAIKFQDRFNSSWRVDSWTREFNGFYRCCGTNVLGHACFHDIVVFRLFAEECDLSDITETGVITVLQGKTEFDLNESFTIRCIFVSAFMDQPPSWWYQQSRGASYNRLRGFQAHYTINASFDEERCVWMSDLTVDKFSLELVGVYSCIRGSLNQSISIDIQACYRNVPSNSSIAILGLDEQRSIGSNFSLTCTVARANPASVPSWCRVTGRGCELLTGNATFSEETCTWVTVFRVSNFSNELEGTYRCFVPNTTLSDEAELSVLNTLNDGLFFMDTTSIAVSVTIGVIAIVLIAFGATAVMIHWFRVTPFERTSEPPYKGFVWDVFISYHREAEDFAIQHVKWPLERSLYRVCWHHDDFIAGRTISDNINEAVDNSRKVVIILSESFTTSDHCMMELVRSLERLQITRTRCIVPIVIDHSHIPEELKSRVTYWPVIEVDKNFNENLMKTIGSPISGTERMTEQINS